MVEEPSFLDGLRIASPCKASWDKMEGDLRVRFCGECKKNVYDLRYMARAEAEALLLKSGEACVRMARRADGTVITADCPVGRADQRKKAAAATALGAGLIAATALLWKVRSQPPPAELDLVDIPREVLVPERLGQTLAEMGQRQQTAEQEERREPIPMGAIAIHPPEPPRFPHGRHPPRPPPTDTVSTDHEGVRLLSGNFSP
ncbi:MAG: hypothetical protein HOV80_16640 [Polyangiaceae bacterium]|nr:hypothetical protein [Polyangiaceae bacterium]